jgi:hypothetical protein
MEERSIYRMGWDTTCPVTFALSSDIKAGSAAAATERKKLQKYVDFIVSIDFIPAAIDTSGVWGEQALELMTEIGPWNAAVTYEPLS